MPTPQPTDGSWLPQVDVRRHVGTSEGSDQDSDANAARLAATSYVERKRPDLRTVDPVTGAVSYAATPDVRHGALLLAARLYARKGSPTGLASYGEFGPAAVLRLDPDIERLLGIGRNVRPVVR